MMNFPWIDLKAPGIHSNLESTILEIWNSGHKNQICYAETMVSDMWAMFHHVSPCFTMFPHVSMFSSFRIFRQSRWHMVTCAGCTTLWRQGGWIGYHTDPTSLYDKHVWNLDVTGQSLIELETEKEFLQKIRQLCEAIPEFVVNFLGWLNMLLRSSGRAGGSGTVGSSQIAVVGELGPGPNSSSVLSRTLRKAKVIDGYWCALEWFLQQSGIVSWIVRALNFCIVAFWWVSRPCYICSTVRKQIESETWVVHSHATCHCNIKFSDGPNISTSWFFELIRSYMNSKRYHQLYQLRPGFSQALGWTNPAVCSDCRQDVEVGFRDHVAFGWHGQISGKGTTCPVQICQYAWCLCFSKRMVFQAGPKALEFMEMTGGQEVHG